VIRRQYFGWLKNDRFHLSLYPPDAPHRPSVALDTVDEVRALLASRKRIEILWWPPLPDKIHAEIGTRSSDGLRLEGRR